MSTSALGFLWEDFWPLNPFSLLCNSFSFLLFLGTVLVNCLLLLMYPLHLYVQIYWYKVVYNILCLLNFCFSRVEYHFFIQEIRKVPSFSWSALSLVTSLVILFKNQLLALLIRLIHIAFLLHMFLLLSLGFSCFYFSYIELH